MKKILVLAESLRINETSSGIVSSTLIAKIIESGFDLTVLYPKTFDYKITWLGSCRLIAFSYEKHTTSLFQKIPKLRALTSYYNLGFSSHFKSMVSVWKKQILLECNQRSYDYILVLGSGSEFSPHFALSELNISIPYFASIHDPFPIHNYPFPYPNKKTLISWLLEWRFRKVLNKAEGLIFPSQKLAEYMGLKFSEIKGKEYYIPHTSIKLNNLPATSLDSSIELDGSKINIIHAGSLLGPRDPKFLLNAIYDLEKSSPELMKRVNFIFIGKLAREHKSLISMSKSVLIRDQRVSYDRSLNLIEKADAILVIEAISDYSPFMPGKLADIILKEKPIIAICPENSEVKRILGDSPYHSELNDQQKIKEVIIRFLEDFQRNSIYNNSQQLLKYTSKSVVQTINRLFI